jgi:transposase
MSNQELLAQIEDSQIRAIVAAILESNVKLQETLGKQQQTLDKQQQSIEVLQKLLEKQQNHNENLQRMLFGTKSEKMPSIESSLRKKNKLTDEQKEARRAKAKQRRRENKAKKQSIQAEVIEHTVKKEKQFCESCGATEFLALGQEQSLEYEYIPATLKLLKHCRESKICRCQKTIVKADAPPRVGENSQHGPRLHAHVVVAKCLDSMPLHRQSKQFERMGVPLSRSTLTDLFHRCARAVEPIYKRLMERIAEAPDLNGDETGMPEQPGKRADKTEHKKRKCSKSWLWTFLTATMIGFVYSISRSGETPQKVLANTVGSLQVDAYAGYNKVCLPKGRKRVGCFAHVRRKFFESLSTEPAAEIALDFILELYKVEYLAAEENVLGTRRHWAMRTLRSREVMDKFHEWLLKQRESSPPQSPIGKAITYTLNQWKALSQFLENPNLQLDNNSAERALRPIALGRKNFLFVGNEQAGKNLACLQSLVSTCVVNRINPEEYLADILLRVQSHPQDRIDELLPMNWRPSMA